ncbi:HNH endonuclease [Rhodococcus rhodochrous]|uniref:HNH endonuclease n=1 Tax=Rhodococcus rhodochrous TaxID=1829 RepID=UPI00345DBB62
MVTNHGRRTEACTGRATEGRGLSWGQGSGRTGTSQWRNIRAAVLQRDARICQLKYSGCTRRASEVDHIVSVADGGSDSVHNGRAVCTSCHKVQTQRQAAAARRRQRAKLSSPDAGRYPPGH